MTINDFWKQQYRDSKGRFGSTSTPIPTPTKPITFNDNKSSRVDSNLLVGIDRKPSTGVGSDIWNYYEFSGLRTNGVPYDGILKFSFPKEGRKVVEAQSLRSYLNSFNNDDALKSYSIYGLEEKIKKDIRDKLGIFPTVVFHSLNNLHFKKVTNWTNVITIEDYFNEVELDKFPQLESVDISNSPIYSKVKMPMLRCSLLRCICPATKQPDYADVYIYSVPDKHSIVLESLLAYIISFRNKEIYNEDICDVIYNDIYEKFKPKQLLVACLFTRRFGIDINPIRASNYDLISNLMPGLSFCNSLHVRTDRQ